MKNPLAELMARLPQGSSRVLGIRLVMFGVFAGSAGLVWWSVDRLAPLDKQLEIQNTKMAALENEIQQLELNPNPLLVEQMAARFKQIQEVLFTNRDEAMSWHELRRQPKRFVMTPETGGWTTQACPLSGQKFTIVSANLELQATPENRATTSSYKALIDYAQNLTTQKKRVDLTELTVSGSSNSVSVARMTVQLWAQENGP